MINTIVSLVYFIPILLYSFGVLLIIYALNKLRCPAISEKPDVTIIVAARNESRNIGRCLDSLEAQDYPRDKYSVIIVDDRSDDDTGAIVQDHISSWSRLRLLRIDATPAGVSSKKHALMSALGQVETDIVLQTDADCAVPRSWISGMVRYFADNVGFVAGLSPYERAPGLLNSFIRHEYLWNAGLLAGAIAMGSGTHATGRNMGFRLSAFYAAGGYGDSLTVASGDDTLLLQRILGRTSYRIAVAVDHETHVVTESPLEFGPFLRQRLRHMSTGKLFGVARLFAGTAVYGLHVLILFAPLVSVILPETLIPTMIILIVKLCMDCIAAITIRKRLSLDVQWGKYLLNELFLVAYMAILPLFGSFVSVKWKEKG